MSESGAANPQKTKDESKIDWSLAISIFAVVISASSAFFTYRNSEGTRENARLKHLEMTADVRTFLQILPGPDGPSLMVRVANRGAPVAVESLGFEFNTEHGSRIYFLLQPVGLGFPKKLERFESFTTTINRDIFRGSGRRAQEALSFMVVTGAGEFRSDDKINLSKFLASIPTE